MHGHMFVTMFVLVLTREFVLLENLAGIYNINNNWGWARISVVTVMHEHILRL